MKKHTEEWLIQKFNLPDEHCSSCHYDKELGYDMVEIDVDGVYIEVCCKISAAFENVYESGWVIK